MPSFNEIYEKIKVYRDKFGGGLRWNSIVEDILYAYDLCFAKLEKQVANEEMWDILFNIIESEKKLEVIYSNINYKNFFDKVIWIMIEDPDWRWHGWKDIISLFEK
jgi:hypothetical protein